MREEDAEIVARFADIADLYRQAIADIADLYRQAIDALVIEFWPVQAGTSERYYTIRRPCDTAVLGRGHSLVEALDNFAQNMYMESE